MNPAVGSLIMCLESVFSALGGWVLLHQSLSPREGVGCVLIFAAVVLAQLPAPQRAERNKEITASFKDLSPVHAWRGRRTAGRWC